MDPKQLREHLRSGLRRRTDKLLVELEHAVKTRSEMVELGLQLHAQGATTRDLDALTLGAISRTTWAKIISDPEAYKVSAVHLHLAQIVARRIDEDDATEEQVREEEQKASHG